MSLHHVASGEPFAIRPLGEKLGESLSNALFKSSSLEVIRMVLQKGRSVPEHHVAGELTMQCLEGAVDLHAHGKSQILRAGEMVYLEGNIPYALQAVENSSVLLTIVLMPDEQPGRPAN